MVARMYEIPLRVLKKIFFMNANEMLNQRHCIERRDFYILP